MKKLKKITAFLIINGLLLIVAAVILQLFTPFGGIHKGASFGTEYFSGVREIVVVSGSLPVDLSYTDGDECEVSWVSELPLIVNCDEQGMLRITQDDSFTLSLFSLNSSDYRISVKIPRKSYGRVSLSSSGGEIKVTDNISCEVLEISTKNGDILALNADERTRIKSTSGNIYLSLSGLNGDMTVNGGEGDIHVNVPPELPFFMEFSTENGSCTTIGFSENITDRKGDAALLSGNGGHNLDIKTTSGSLELLSDIKRPPAE